MDYSIGWGGYRAPLKTERIESSLFRELCGHEIKPMLNESLVISLIFSGFLLYSIALKRE